MKRIAVKEYGGPDVLTLEEVDVPSPDAGQVLVKVGAAGFNYADIMQREGLYPGGPKPPYGAGFEIAGTVESVGDGVANVTPGGRVMGFCSGGYAEYAIAPADQLMPIPGDLPFAEAAAIPCQYFTAYHALITLGKLHGGETCLIQAAAGGLGSIMVQIARNVGAVIMGTCSTQEKAAFIQELGCEHPIVYTEEDFAAKAMALTNNHGCELVIESVGGEVFEKSLKIVKRRGMLITLGLASKTPVMVNPVELLAGNKTLAGFHLMDYMKDTGAVKHAVHDLNEWLAEGKLQFFVKHTYSIDEAAQAHRDVSERKTSGKVVLTP